MASRFSYVLLVLLCTFSCQDNFEKKYTWHTLKVTATAYNSIANQTNSNPNITAFGDTLKPDLKYIAVSRDLLKMGLKENTPVKIDSLDGIYFVKDKMHYRWKNRIDVYMGTDVKAAKNWGRKKINITYGLLKEQMD